MIWLLSTDEALLRNVLSLSCVELITHVCSLQKLHNQILSMFKLSTSYECFMVIKRQAIYPLWWPAWRDLQAEHKKMVFFVGVVGQTQSARLLNMIKWEISCALVGFERLHAICLYPKSNIYF